MLQLSLTETTNFQTLSGKSYEASKWTLSFANSRLETDYQRYLIIKNLPMAFVVNCFVPLYTYILLGYYDITMQWFSYGPFVLIIPSISVIWSFAAVYLCWLASKKQSQYLLSKMEFVYVICHFMYVDVLLILLSVYLRIQGFPTQFLAWNALMSMVFSIVLRRRFLLTLISTVITCIVNFSFTYTIVQYTYYQLVDQIPVMLSTIIAVAIYVYQAEIMLRSQFLNEKETESWKIDLNDVVYDSLIGQGTFGQVYRGKWKGNLVAIKKLLPPDDSHCNDLVSQPQSPNTARKSVKDMALLIKDVPYKIKSWLSVSESKRQKQKEASKSLQAFEREIRVMCNLRHPNIVTFMGAYLQKPDMLLVTELCENASLFEFIDSSTYQDIDPMVRVNLATGSALGLNYLHSQNPPIIHRDFKSLNILIDASHNAKVCDFGLSEFAGTIEFQGSMSRKGKRRLGQRKREEEKLIGSVPWIAPEVFKTGKHNIQSDTFSLAIVIWEIFSELHPYMEELQAGLTVEELINGICDEGLRPSIKKYLARPDPFTPVEIIELLRLAWHKDATKRPSIIELIERLTAAKLSAKAYMHNRGLRADSSEGSQTVASESSFSILNGKQSPDIINKNGDSDRLRLMPAQLYKSSIRGDALLPNIVERSTILASRLQIEQTQSALHSADVILSQEVRSQPQVQQNVEAPAAITSHSSLQDLYLTQKP
ncbi:hypothetical protein MP228_003556 [Amoeboaphelidium protococcarum]|nr:hypothetical protein MP228_003556 [Amoeboaphelidium protococcarum]